MLQTQWTKHENFWKKPTEVKKRKKRELKLGLDIFSLQYFKITPLNPFEANVPFLYPLKWVKKVECGRNNIYSIRKFRKAPQHTHSINQCSLLQVSVLSYARSISFHLYLKTFALSLFATDCFLRYVDQWCSLYIYYIFLSVKMFSLYGRWNRLLICKTTEFCKNFILQTCYIFVKNIM